MRIITKEEVLAHRLRAHHLDTAITSLEVASSTCGFQNSPPGTWLCAAFNRLQEVTAKQLREQLDKQQGVMQAWSLRGAPWIFPVKDAAVFLDALCAKQDESWIYAGGLKHCQQDMKVPFELLLKELMECLRMLKQEPVISKQRLDTLLAGNAGTYSCIPADIVELSFSLCGRTAVWGSHRLFSVETCLLSKRDHLRTKTESITIVYSIS